MKPSPERVEQLKEIYKQETGKELSVEQTHKEMRQIIGLAEIELEECEKRNSTN